MFLKGSNQLPNHIKVCSEIPLGKNSYHIKTSQLICFANQLTGFFMIRAEAEVAILALTEEREKVRESRFRRCYDFALTRGKSLNIESDIPRIAGRLIITCEICVFHFFTS